MRPVVVAGVAGAAVVVLAVTAVVVAALHAASGPGSRPASATLEAADDQTATPDEAARPASAACRPAPLARRAARLIVAGLPGVTRPRDPLVRTVVDEGVGGVLLKADNIVSPGQVRRLVQALRSGRGPGPVVATDEELGRVSSFRSVLGTTASARTLAATLSPGRVRALARDLARRLAGLGVDLDLAPVADLDAGAAGGLIGDRSFSADPHLAAGYALAFSRGLVDGGVLPAAKHFPGHGRTTVDTHAGPATVTATRGQLQRSDLVPFAAQVRAGVPVVMLGHVVYDRLDRGVPATLSPRVYRLLRDLGFDGVAMTDALGMGAIAARWGQPEAAVRAVTAGADAVLTTDGRTAPKIRRALAGAVRDGRLGEARLDEAVGRMLALKGVDPATMVCGSDAAPTAMAVAAGRG